MALTKPKLSTNINTDSSVFTDPILVLHQGSSVADVDVGFLMNRSNGLTANAAVIWQESSRSFVHILTNSSGAPDANLNVQSYANVSVGNVLLINNAGIYVDGTLGTAGQVLASDGSKSYWAPPGGFTGGTVAGVTIFQSNLVVSNTTVSTNTTTGALVVLGGAGIAGNVYADKFYVTSDIFWAGNSNQFTANAANWLTIIESTDDNVTYNIPYIGDVNSGTAAGSPRRLYSDATGLTFNPSTNTLSVSIVSATTITGSGVLSTTSNTQATSTTTGALRATGGLAINTGNVYIGGSAGRSITAAGNITVTGSASTNTTTGALVVVGGAGISGALYTGGIIDAAGNIIADSGTASTSTTTGALIVNGGAGVSGNVYSNALYTATGVYWSGNGQAFTSTTIANTAEITANLSSGQNVGLSLTVTGVVAGNYGSATSIPTIVVDTKGRITSVTSNAVSTTITLAGGSGSGSVSGGGTLTVNGTTNQITTAVSGSTITIALAQDVTAPGNVTVTGNLVVQGNTTTLNTETLTIEDLNITVANGAINAAAADGAGITVGGANARLLYKSATDSWVFDRGVFASGNLVANSGTVSSSVTSGALVVTGGAGISGALHIQNTGDVSANIGTLFTGNNVTNANLGAFQIFSNANAATQATSINTINANIGAYQTYANANVVAIQANIGAFYNYANTKIGTNTNSNLVVVATTTSTSTTTGALVVDGGAGVSGNLYVSNISVGSGNIQFAQKSGMISGATAYLSLLGNPSGSAGISALELAGYTGVAGGTQSRLDFVSKVSNVFYNTSRISSMNGPSSTAAGQLVFSTTPDGGSLTERLRIKDDGPIVTAANIVAVGSATSNTTTGAIVVVGGIGLSGGIIAGGNIVAAAVTNSVSTTTGALVVRGGAGVAGNVYMDRLYTTNGLYWSGNGNVIVTGGGATLGFPNSTVAVFPTGDYGDFTATKDAFGVHIDTVYDTMEPVGSYSTTDLN